METLSRIILFVARQRSWVDPNSLKDTTELYDDLYLKARSCCRRLGWLAASAECFADVRGAPMQRLRMFLPALASAILLGGCGGGSGTTQVTSLPAAGGTVPQSRVANFDSDACSTPVTEKIKSKGGTLKLPSCGGISGKVTYGANNSSHGDSVSLATYTTNPNPSACGAPAGETVVLFGTANYDTSQSETYQAATKDSTLKDKSFVASDTYTFYVFQSGAQVLAESLGSPKKGILTFASPLNGATLSAGAAICFELATP
jgi:hypothetical protein